MNPSARCIRGVVIGTAVLLIGFVLLLKDDFWKIPYSNGSPAAALLPQGSLVAPYEKDFETLARLLMYSGAALGVSSAVLWVYGPARHSLPPAA